MESSPSPEIAGLRRRRPKGLHAPTVDEEEEKKTSWWVTAAMGGLVAAARGKMTREAATMGGEEGKMTRGAAAMGGEKKKILVAALILENTFTSILDMAGSLPPFLKCFMGGSGSKGPKVLNFLVHSPWNTIDAIGEIKQPILFLSGLRDEMVPPSHMQLLYAKAAARDNKCKFVYFPNGRHMDTWWVGGDKYWRTIQQFFEEHVPEKKEIQSSSNGDGTVFL